VLSVKENQSFIFLSFDDYTTFMPFYGSICFDGRKKFKYPGRLSNYKVNNIQMLPQIQATLMWQKYCTALP